jgi:hypothetical protein
MNPVFSPETLNLVPIETVDFQSLFHKNYPSMSDNDLVEYYSQLNAYLGILKHQFHDADKNKGNDNFRNGHIDVIRYEKFGRFLGDQGSFEKWLKRMITSFNHVWRNRHLEIQNVEKEMHVLMEEIEKRNIKLKKSKTPSRSQKNKNLLHEN